MWKNLLGSAGGHGGTEEGREEVGDKGRKEERERKEGRGERRWVIKEGGRERRWVVKEGWRGEERGGVEGERER